MPGSSRVWSILKLSILSICLLRLFDKLSISFKGRLSTANCKLKEIFQVDNAPPAAPVLSVSQSELSVTLKWTNSSIPRDFAKYNVYEYDSNENKYTLIGETTSTVATNTVITINGTTIDGSGLPDNGQVITIPTPTQTQNP